MQSVILIGSQWLLVFWPKNRKPIRGCVDTMATNKPLRLEIYFFSHRRKKKKAAVKLEGGLTN